MDADRGEDPAQNHTPVCAIGASAGGVTALQSLFRLLPTDLGLSYVVILHLAPDQPSSLSEILSLSTSMPVVQVEDSPTLQPDQVYVIPPDRELLIEGDSITAQPFRQPRGSRAPIDMFFRSIAAGRGDGMAVVLSGAGADGAQGVRSIKEAGGVVLVQEPGEAGFASMPQNAIATGVADFILPVGRMAERIAEVARSKEAVRSLDMDGAANDLRRIIAYLRGRVGHDFSSYKRATVLRRVRRRMQVCRTDTLAAYLDHLYTTPEEPQALFADLLISVTSFFRDPGAFDALQRQVIRPLFDDLDPLDGAGLRAWCVGCATGEEAYSVAILLMEEAERRKWYVPLQVFATDLDEEALAKARDGRYPRSIETDVSEERLARFFVDEGTHYRIRQEIRDVVLFATHSVLKEPPFLRLDLITCRNLLIYLERSMQQQVDGIFHYGLKPGRFLFLGSAETADVASELFSVLDRDARIYVSRPHAAQRLPILPQYSVPERFVTAGHGGATARTGQAGLPAALHITALEALAPPSVLVDDGHNILHLSPSAGRFILLSGGPASNLLPAMVRQELRLDLKVALTRATEQRLPTLTHAVAVGFENGRSRVAMHVLPVPVDSRMGVQVLVTFLDGGPVVDGDLLPAEDDAAPHETRRLHAELKSAQEALVLSRSGHDSSMQELRAANEELQSINEEHRSTAEELETSKEELQSINEELHTVNAELKSKLESISVAHSDLENLTAATEIGTLFLTPDLRIKMFTPPVIELFNITRFDVGRFITDFTHGLDHPGLEQDVRQVLSDLMPVEREVMTNSGRWFVMRIRPYRTVDNRVDGLALTFVDISSRIGAEAALARSEEQFRSLVRASSQVLYRMGPDWMEMRELIGGGFLEDTTASRTDWMAHYIPADTQAVVRNTIRQAVESKSVFELEHRVLRADGSLGWMLSRAVPLLDQAGIITDWFGAATDVTERRDAVEAMGRLNETLEQQVAERTAQLTLYRNIVQSNRFPICAYDVAQRVTAFNKAHADEWRRVIGREAFVGEVMPDALPPGQVAMQRGFASRALAGEKFTVEAEFGNPDLAMPHWEMDYAPVRDEAGAIIGAFHHARDVTARLKVEAELAKAEEALRQSQKMEAVGQLTGGLAHDFNNLLTGVTGSLELMQTRIAQGRVADVGRYIDAAQGAAKRAASLTHRLLAFSRRQTLDPRPTDVNQLVTGMQDMVMRTAGPAINVKVFGSPELWPTRIDAGQLENALLNLCINARDAMPEGGQLTIETANHQLDERFAYDRDMNAGEYVSLAVSDTGTGMLPEVVAKAFDPFFTTKPIGLGTGLGLSMIYGFARQSGGQVRIHSQEGRGTTVCLYLPRFVGEADAVLRAAKLADAPRGERGQTVLVVDDEVTVRMLVVEVLEDLGYRTIEAENGASGLQVLQSDTRIDLLVTDVGLPGGMNGRQVADAARVARPDLKVLFITGFAENAVLSHGHLDPGMHVLTKPFTLETLASRIKELIAD